MSLFGIPFFLAGILMALTLAGVLRMDMKSGGKWGPLVLGVMSVVFTAVGGGLVFGRRWITLDLGSGSVIRSQGLLVPMRKEERRLSEFRAVMLSFHAGDSDSADRYPVCLRAMIGKDLQIAAPTKFGEARSTAEFLSRAIRLPLEDSTTDHEVIVSPDHAGDTLRQRLRAGAVPARVEPPPAMRSQVHESRGEATVVIPGGGGKLVGLFAVLLPLGVFVFVVPWLQRFFEQTNTPRGVGFAFEAALVVIFVIPSMIASLKLLLGSQRKQTTVKASAAGIAIERERNRHHEVTNVTAEDLLDLDVSTFEGLVRSAQRGRQTQGEAPIPQPLERVTKWMPTKGIIIKSRTEMITFGEALSPAELEYLASVLKKAIRE